jgi:hypothetical protein
VSASETQNGGFIGNVVHADTEPRKVQEECRGLGVGDTPPAFVHDQDMSYLEPPRGGYYALLGSHLLESQTGIGMIFIVECPARRDRCI